MPYKDPKVKKEKHAVYSAKHYETTKAATKLRIKERSSSNKKQWDLYKSTLKCVKCNFAHPAALDFHHVDPKEKEYSISALVSNKSFTKAMKEAKKCIILCANCHRVHHFEERKNPAL